MTRDTDFPTPKVVTYFTMPAKQPKETRKKSSQKVLGET